MRPGGQQRPDGDVQHAPAGRLGLRGRPQVPDAPGVHASARRFKFRDDLHGPDLRRAGDGAARERGPHQVHHVAPPVEPALDRGDGVEDRCVRLDGPRLGHADAAVRAHAAEVVALEVDDHDEFGLVLFGGEEVGPHATVECGGGLAGGRGALRPAGAGALDRPRQHPPAPQVQKEFRAGREDGPALAQAHVCRVGGGVGPPQPPVQVPRLLVPGAGQGGHRLASHGEPSAEVGLEDVAGGDVVADAFDGAQVAVVAEVTVERPGVAGRGRRLAPVRGAFRRPVSMRRLPGKGRPEGLGRGPVLPAHQVGLPIVGVEHQDRLVQAQVQVGQGDVADRRQAGRRLHVRAQVVRQVPVQAGTERAPRGGGVARARTGRSGQRLPERAERVARDGQADRTVGRQQPRDVGLVDEDGQGLDRQHAPTRGLPLACARG